MINNTPEAWGEPAVVKHMGRYPCGNPNPLRSVYSDPDDEWPQQVFFFQQRPRQTYDTSYYRPLAVRKDGAYVAWGEEDRLLAARRRNREVKKKYVDAIIEHNLFGKSDIAAHVLKFWVPEEVYVKWTLRGMRNGTWDRPFCNDEGEIETLQAPHIQDCLQLIEPTSEFSLICDEHVCVAQMAQDTVHARNSNQLFSYGLPKDETCYDTVPEDMIRNSAAHNWPNGVYAKWEADGGLTFTHKADPRCGRWGDMDNDEFSAEILVVPKAVSLLSYQQQELVDRRLLSKATHHIIAFQESEVYLTPDEVKDSNFVWMLPIRLRYDEDDPIMTSVNAPVQQRESPNDVAGYTDWNFVAQHVWSAELVRPLAGSRAEFKPFK